jgi:hypothetical protein
LQERRGDGQLVTSSKTKNLILIAERCSHDDGGVRELLEVAVDCSNRDHARVLSASEGLACLCLVPIHDPADKGGDESDVSLSTGDSLDKREQQSQIAMNSFFFKNLTSSDALVGGGDLKERKRKVNRRGGWVTVRTDGGATLIKILDLSMPTS